MRRGLLSRRSSHRPWDRNSGDWGNPAVATRLGSIAAFALVWENCHERISGRCVAFWPPPGRGLVSISETRRKFPCKEVGLHRTIDPKRDFGHRIGAIAGRIKEARDRAAVYVGSDASEYLDREPRAEQELSASENELVSGAKRVRQLNAHLDHLHRMLEVLKQK